MGCNFFEKHYFLPLCFFSKSYLTFFFWSKSYCFATFVFLGREEERCPPRSTSNVRLSSLKSHRRHNCSLQRLMGCRDFAHCGWDAPNKLSVSRRRDRRELAWAARAACVHGGTEEMQSSENILCQPLEAANKPFNNNNCWTWRFWNWHDRDFALHESMLSVSDLWWSEPFLGILIRVTAVNGVHLSLCAENAKLLTEVGGGPKGGAPKFRVFPSRVPFSVFFLSLSGLCPRRQHCRLLHYQPACHQRTHSCARRSCVSPKRIAEEGAKCVGKKQAQPHRPFRPRSSSINLRLCESLLSTTSVTPFVSMLMPEKAALVVAKTSHKLKLELLHSTVSTLHWL